jgi:hypothetical protein
MRIHLIPDICWVITSNLVVLDAFVLSVVGSLKTLVALLNNLFVIIIFQLIEMRNLYRPKLILEKVLIH